MAIPLSEKLTAGEAGPASYDGENLDPEAYWSESSLSGYYQVVPNREGMPSRVNLEALFNAALRNKETFKALFR